MTGDVERFARDVVHAVSDEERDADRSRLEASWPGLSNAIALLREAVEQREEQPPSSFHRGVSRRADDG